MFFTERSGNTLPWFQRQISHGYGASTEDQIKQAVARGLLEVLMGDVFPTTLIEEMQDVNAHFRTFACTIPQQEKFVRKWGMQITVRIDVVSILYPNVAGKCCWKMYPVPNICVKLFFVLGM